MRCAEALTTAPGLSEAAVSSGCLSEREWNPDPEEIETPLVVAGIPYRLLVVAVVVDRWRRWPPRGRQRTIPYRRRGRAPTPWRGSVAPRGAVETPTPVIVLRTPWWPPIVTAGMVEVAGRATASLVAGRAAGEVAGGTTASLVAGRATRGTAGEVAGRATTSLVTGRATGEVAGRATASWVTRRATASLVAGGAARKVAGRATASLATRRTTRRRTAGRPASAVALHTRGALWRCVGDAGAQADACGAEHAADGGSSYKLTEFHYQAFPRR
jgi:hypothetical protein